MGEVVLLASVLTDAADSWRPVEASLAVVRDADPAPVTIELLELSPGSEAEGTGWQERSLCAETDPEAFFPEKGGSTREAKAVCLSCEVRQECLEYALENDERFGIWGGLSERERRRIRRSAV